MGGEIEPAPARHTTTIDDLEEVKVDPTESQDIQHEDYGLPVLGEAGLLKSRLDQLSLLKTLWVFRRATGYCVLTFAWGALDGWEGGISGQVVAMRGFTAEFGKVKGVTGVDNLDTRWLSAWGAAINIGQLITLTYIAYVSNRWGKKVAFYWCWLCFATGLALMTGAKTPVQWFFARLIIGMGAGVQQSLCGPYIMEVAPNRIRGGIYFFPWTAAAQICSSVMIQQTNLKYPDFWRLPIYILWATTGLMGIIILAVPESPWYYARHGKKEQCMKVLKRLYGNIPEYNYEEEYAILEKTLEVERQLLAAASTRPWNDIFKGVNGRKTLVLIVLNIGAQFSGGAVVNNYASYFFTLAGVKDPFLVGIVQAVVTAAFSALWAFMIDKVGRRWPYAIAYGLQCAIMWCIGGLWYTREDKSSIGLIFLASVWSIAFGMMGCVNGVLMAELPTATLRMKTVTFAYAINGIMGIAVSEFTPPLLAALNLRAGFIYGGISLPIFIYALFFLPETKGRSVAEIDELFERRIKAWRWAKTVTEVENHLHATVLADEKGATQA